MTNAELLLVKLQGVSATLRREKNKYLFWREFKGNISIDGTIGNNDLRIGFSGSPIEVNNSLKIQGMGNTMIMPRKKEYTGVPKYGDSIVKGKEERTSWEWTQIHYNQIRHGIITQEGEQDTAVEAAFNAAVTEMPALARYFAKIENWNVTASIYEALSENLSASADDDGLGLTVRYHPNTYYVYDIGTSAKIKIAEGLTKGTFPTTTIMDNTCDAVDAAANHIIDTAVLDELAALCMRLDITPIVSKNGNLFWLLIVDPAQAAYIRQDASFLAAQREAIIGRELADNPLFNGSIGIWNQFVIKQDQVIVRGWDKANNNFLGLNESNLNQDDYGELVKYNRRFMPMRTASTNRMAIVLGASAIGNVEHTPLGYRTEEEDYQNLRGLAGTTKYGYARLDNVAQNQLQYLSYSPSSVTTARNDGSLVLMSYVPATNV